MRLGSRFAGSWFASRFEKRTRIGIDTASPKAIASRLPIEGSAANVDEAASLTAERMIAWSVSFAMRIAKIVLHCDRMVGDSSDGRWVIRQSETPYFRPSLAIWEIARRVGTDIAMVQRMESRLGGPDRSLDLPQGEDGELDPMSRIVDHRPDPEAVTMAQIDGEVRSQWLHEAIGDLNEREQIIIRTRRLSDEGSTLAEIGEMLGISKERVRQIESRALDKLRTSILERADYPDDLLSEA